VAGQLPGKPGDQTDSVLVPALQQHLHDLLDVTVMGALCYLTYFDHMSLQMSTQLKEHVKTFVARCAIVQCTLSQYENI